ncbi:fmn-dependent dehydrogenase [Trichoderma arundinaceum]|uniref:Fmn-dependent dehydrogenase n=1 Tax=Trichoderma arundinaceum TaxID=490622 RepID=A0A395NPQ9_TRIAR|nr:fmn-dependent dehydrogenase [Trichoderma arundinaceum]
MRCHLFTAVLASGALAARQFLNEPDTGIEDILGDLPKGTLPNLSDMIGLPDFDWAARHYLPTKNYTYYRNGAAGEWSYRNNLEVFHSPCARGAYGHPDAELNLIKGAAAGNILYMPALLASYTIEQIAAAKAEGQVVFQQLYLSSNDTETRQLLDRSKAAGASAIVFTVDSAADGNRHRAARFGVGSADSEYTYITWDYYKKITSMTDLPVILKGIMSVEDAKLAVKNKVPAIILSNHGGRQLDGSPSSLEVALEIHEKAPEVFKQIEVYADGGVRYGADVLKLLSLGVKAVGLGRPFMFANIFGTKGIEKAIQIIKHEIAIDAANLGVGNLAKIDPSYVQWTPNNWLE